MYNLLISPILTGISTGMFCMTFCVPFVAPLLVTEEKNVKQTAKALELFMLGRLIGYIAFGALFGYLGEKLTNQTYSAISIAALMLLSLLLIVHAIGLWKPKSLFCGFSSKKVKLPFWVGVLTGVNLCPPFLLSLTYVFTLHDTLRGMLYFFMFFLGTNIYFIPLVLLSHLSQIKMFQKYARIAAFIVGFSFFFYGIFYLWRGETISHIF